MTDYPPNMIGFDLPLTCACGLLFAAVAFVALAREVAVTFRGRR